MSMSSSTTDTKPDEPARMDGPNAHVVDQLLGNDHRKRSRPTGTSSGSSLDYHKPEDADSLLTPGHIPESLEEEEKYHQAAEDGRPKIATRARGSSGIPPRGKLQLEDLQGMSEDEVMRALYEDPELAAAAVAASQMDTDKPGPASSTSGKSTTPKIPQGKRVDGLKERGFPFVQWAVLLLLLGLATHQIYKSMSAPSSKTRNKKSSKAKNSRTVKSGSVKNKAKPSAPTEDVKEIEKEVFDDKTETSPPAKQNVSEKTPPTLKRKNVKTRKTKVSSSGADDAIAPSVSETLLPQKKAVVTETSISDDGWTTVGKESDSKPKVEAKNGSSKPAAKPAEAATVQEESKAPETNDFQPVATKSKKKNKKKKTQENGNSTKHDSNLGENGTERDAALAMELQQFEQSSLQSEAIEHTVDVWEEVKPKKRK